MITGDAPELSIVIVSYRCRDLLRDCLVSLDANRRSVDLEVEVLDNASGDGTIDDPAFRHFLAGTGPTLADPLQSQTDAQRAGAELLDLIGPAIVLSHSAGGPPGWLIADARPDGVKALIAMEPLGPPFTALSAAGSSNDNLYYTGTPGTRYNPATGLGTPDLARLAHVFAAGR